jgi:hypothetical protein
MVNDCKVRGKRIKTFFRIPRIHIEYMAKSLSKFTKRSMTVPWYFLLSSINSLFYYNNKTSMSSMQVQRSAIYAFLIPFSGSNYMSKTALNSQREAFEILIYIQWISKYFCALIWGYKVEYLWLNVNAPRQKRDPEHIIHETRFCPLLPRDI